MGLMVPNLATLNARGLRGPSKCACLLGELSNFSVDVAVEQETRFTCDMDCQVLKDDYVVLSAYGSRSTVDVSQLVGCSLKADVNLALVDDGGRLVVATVAVKSFEFRVVAVYAPNIAAERASFYRQLAPCLDAEADNYNG